MTTLTVCIGLVWGLCGHVVTGDYKTMAECEKALTRFDGKPNITYAYCKEKSK
jgi:hypothetical protein